jgi:hypothetical protein
MGRSLGELPSACQCESATPNRRFEFHKRSQLFIRAHNETLFVTAMRIRDPDCAPLKIHG